MYNSSNVSKFKSQRNVCRIDLNDVSDRQKQANTPTVSKRIANFSPVSHNPIKNSSSFHTLLSQLQPSTTKNPKNYSQQKQMLITKKNEIIKNAIKQNLNTKKPGTPKLDNQENWEYSLVKAHDKYGKENELPSDGGARSRERMDQFYHNMRYARPASAAKQHNVDRGNGIASFISPNNKSYMQKAVIPNSTVNLSGISNTNEPKTANTTIIKYNQDYRENNNSYVKEKGRSFDLKHDSPSNKYPAQNRILLDLDESLNLAPIDQVKTSNTTAHAKYSKSREEIQNILSSNVHYQPLNISGHASRQPLGNYPCKIVKEQENFEKVHHREGSPEKDIFELNMSPIKSNNRSSSAINFSDINNRDSKAAKNLANQPYPTIIKQINLNTNTPTAVGKPPLHGYMQQAEYYLPNSNITPEIQQKAGQEAMKHKALNIQTVKENKRIEFPSYLQNLTCDRQNHMQDYGKNRGLTAEELQLKAGFQPSALNYFERLGRHRYASNDNSREYTADKTTPESHFRFPLHGDQGSGRHVSGHMHRLSYGDAPKRLDISDNTEKHVLNISANLPNGRHIDVGTKRNQENLVEEIIPQSVKANMLNHEKYMKEMNEIMAKKENRVLQEHNQNQLPAPNQVNDDKEAAKKQVSMSDVNIMDFDPEEKELRIRRFREEYVVGKQIGQGAYATVRIGLHKPTNTKVAIKIYEKVKIMDPMRRRSVRREIKLMQRMDHPNIIKILDIIETNNHMNIVMEYIGGTSLHSFLKAQPNRRLKEDHAFNIFKQVVAGLYYCHSRCITHRDIKLENMLLDNHGNLKIIDFGFSTCIPNDKKVKMFCGTPSYMAPEIVTKIEYCGPPADIWALGVLLYALLSGTFPFRGENDKELYRKIAAGEFVLPEFISDKAASLITKMITVDTEKRITSKEIMNESWYLMHAFLEKKPDRRHGTRSNSAAEEMRAERAENRVPSPMNINLAQPVIESPFMQINNYLKSPPYNPNINPLERPNLMNTNQKDENLSREFMRHLSPNNFRSLFKQTPTASHNQTHNFYNDTKNMTYNLNLKENANASYGTRDAIENDIAAVDDNFDENRLKCKKTISEIEVWNVPANISDKSFQRTSGKSSFIQPSTFNRSYKRGDENANASDNEIVSNMLKMGYKEDEINQGLRERNGPAYSIFNRMQNEKRALNYSGYGDSEISDQNNNNSFNLSSNTGLKRKSLNLWVQKNPSQGNQGKENMYTHVLRTASTKDLAANQDDVLKPLSSNNNRKDVLGEITLS